MKTKTTLLLLASMLFALAATGLKAQEEGSNEEKTTFQWVKDPDAVQSNGLWYRKDKSGKLAKLNQFTSSDGEVRRLDAAGIYRTKEAFLPDRPAVKTEKGVYYRLGADGVYRKMSEFQAATGEIYHLDENEKYVPLPHAPVSLFVNGGDSKYSNMPSEEMDALVFGSLLGTDRMRFLNANDSKSERTPTLNWQENGSQVRTDYGTPAMKESQLKHLPTKAANKDNVATTLKEMAASKPEAVTLVWGDHGKAEGIALWDGIYSYGNLHKDLGVFSSETMVRRIHTHCNASASFSNHGDVPQDLTHFETFLSENYRPNECAYGVAEPDELGYSYSRGTDPKNSFWTKVFEKKRNASLKDISDEAYLAPPTSSTHRLTSDTLTEEVFTFLCKNQETYFPQEKETETPPSAEGTELDHEVKKPTPRLKAVNVCDETSDERRLKQLKEATNAFDEELMDLLRVNGRLLIEFDKRNTSRKEYWRDWAEEEVNLNQSLKGKRGGTMRWSVFKHPSVTNPNGGDTLQEYWFQDKANHYKGTASAFDLFAREFFSVDLTTPDGQAFLEKLRTEKPGVALAFERVIKKYGNRFVNISSRVDELFEARKQNQKTRQQYIFRIRERKGGIVQKAMKEFKELSNVKELYQKLRTCEASPLYTTPPKRTPAPATEPEPDLNPGVPSIYKKVAVPERDFVPPPPAEAEKGALK